MRIIEQGFVKAHGAQKHILRTHEQGFVKEVVDDAQKHVFCALLNKGLYGPMVHRSM